jgi:hypothetical protein
VVHLQKNGFTVKSEDLADLRPIKAKHGVPEELESCHTGVIDGYVVEGHVPADVIVKLLTDRPKVAGIAVPGMPIGSPGMESPGRRPERYTIYTFAQKRKAGVFATR